MFMSARHREMSGFNHEDQDTWLRNAERIQLKQSCAVCTASGEDAEITR